MHKEFSQLQSFQNEIDKFLKNIKEAKKAANIDLLRIDEETIAVVG